MAYGSSRGLKIGGLKAGENLSSKQFYWVKAASTAGEIVAVSATTDVAMGILQNAPEDGQEADVQSHGVSKLVAGSTAISYGDLVGWNAEGQGNTRTETGSRFAAQCLEAADADGEMITVNLLGVSRGA